MQSSIDPDAAIDATVAGVAVAALDLVASPLVGLKNHLLEHERVDFAQIAELPARMRNVGELGQTPTRLPLLPPVARLSPAKKTQYCDTEGF